jgi:hypothetical protein
MFSDDNLEDPNFLANCLDSAIRSEISASEVEANYTAEELTYGGLQTSESLIAGWDLVGALIISRKFAAGNLSWREILGQHTWFFLHTVAAKYPDHPTEADQQVCFRKAKMFGIPFFNG